MASRLGYGPTMYQSKKTAEKRRFFKLTAVCLALLSSACSVSTITLSGNYPAPLARKLPITVGVYYPEELRNYAYVEIDDASGKDQYIIQSGESQMRLFNTVLPALFQDVVLLDSLDDVPQNGAIDAVFVPAIEEFQLGLPNKTKLKVYEIWLKYNMRLSKTNGDYIADWVMTAYGKSPDESFQSVDEGVKDAATVAMRDLAASFTLGFTGVPGVSDWLRENNYSP
jgi:hypothetical protein